MPSHEVRGFTFEVQDHRNQIRLVEAPASGNNFTAIVRIRDTGSGYGPYRFRLSWLIDGAPGPGAHSLDGPAPSPENRRAGDGFVWNNVTHYAGRGAGSAAYNDEDSLSLSGVSLDIDRGGHATISFQTRPGRAMVLNGAVIGREGERIKMDAMTEDRRLRGVLYVSVDDRKATVRSVEMEAAGGDDRVRVHWDRR